MPSSCTGSDGSSAPTGGGGDGVVLKKGPWTPAEDAVLIEYVHTHGEGNWNAVQRNTGLMRCGKSCRLRWANHLRPDLKKGAFSQEEERRVLELHAKFGNKWARMASELPGRTDNEIKNYWNTRLKRRLRAGLSVYPIDMQSQPAAPLRCSPPESHNKTHLLNPPPIPPDAHPFGYASVPTATGMMPVLMPMKRPCPGQLCGGGDNNSGLLADSQMAFDHRHQQLKRMRTDGRGFSSMAPFPAASPVPPTSPPPPPLFGYVSGNYDQGQFPLTLQQQSQIQQQRLQQQQTLSIIMELPSNQLFSAPDAADTATGNIGELFGLRDSGTLEALLEESRERCGMREPKMEGVDWVDEESGNDPSSGRGRDGAVPVSKAASPCDNTSSLSTEYKLKNEQVHEAESIDEDITGLFDDIPAPTQSALTAGLPEWFGSEGEDMSHGQSSMEGNNELPLDMQQLTASLSTEYQPWSIDCHWNNTNSSC